MLVLKVSSWISTLINPRYCTAEQESDIMERPPRDSRTDRLVTPRLVSHSYLIVGVVQAFAGFLAYMAVLNDYGYTPNV